VHNGEYVSIRWEKNIVQQHKSTVALPGVGSRVGIGGLGMWGWKSPVGFRGEVSGGLYPPEAEPLLINEHGIFKVYGISSQYMMVVTASCLTHSDNELSALFNPDFQNGFGVKGTNNSSSLCRSQDLHCGRTSIVVWCFSCDFQLCLRRTNYLLTMTSRSLL